MQHFTLHFTHGVALDFILVHDQKEAVFVSLWSSGEVTPALSKACLFLLSSCQLAVLSLYKAARIKGNTGISLVSV